MEKRPSRHNIFRIVLALVFVAFGLIALGNNLGWWQIDDLFVEWWPLILVLIGLITIFAPGGSWGGGIFLIFLGAIFLLHAHGVYDISELIWPAMLVMVGVMVWPRKRSAHYDKKTGEPDSSETYQSTNSDHVFNINTIFNSRRETIRDEALVGGHGTAVFGNLDLDLRQANPKDNVYIEVTAVFGNVSLMVPADWKIVKHGGPIFGKVDDRRTNVPEIGFSKTVAIEMNAVFGRVDLLS
ncbi:MAG: cell wall-active antibiotics response protein [Candidatus Marinimicrobia bacterium]|nr:cell wall-active antibiotics response protein [Candidatus Neomarinimicrobiota bacterium]